MNYLKRLQDLALKLIMFLVWFDLMCFALILAGTVFQWSFFNSAIASTFFAAFGLSLGALAALAILHLVLTLSLISRSISRLAKEKEPVDPANVIRSSRRFRNVVIASLAAIVMIVAYQGFVERNAARHRVTEIEQQLETVAGSTLGDRMVELIEEDAPINELYLVRDEMLLSLEEGARSVTLLIPKKGQRGMVFYQITPWDYNQDEEGSLSAAADRLFVPEKNEEKKFKGLIETQEPFTVVNRHDIRSFYPLVKNGEIKLVLLLDTSRTVSSEYLLSRRKWK
ncbi:MAG: hypothetical protein GF333_01080 [Candidatus Omnitrophica bacterium]|nr:hypothetical protein [Candidatus Omnitrophota bacterium]